MLLHRVLVGFNVDDESKFPWLPGHVVDRHIMALYAIRAPELCRHNVHLQLASFEGPGMEVAHGGQVISALSMHIWLMIVSTAMLDETELN